MAQPTDGSIAGKGEPGTADDDADALAAAPLARASLGEAADASPLVRGAEAGAAACRAADVKYGLEYHAVHSTHALVDGLVGNLVALALLLLLDEGDGLLEQAGDGKRPRARQSLVAESARGAFAEIHPAIEPSRPRRESLRRRHFGEDLSSVVGE